MREIPTDDLNALAERLGGWQPSSGGLNRDRLLYEAGREAGLAEARASYRKRSWPLMTATAASLLLALGSFMSRGHQRDETSRPIEIVDRPKREPATRAIAEEPPTTTIDPNSYLALARQIADGSLDPIVSEPAQAAGPNRPAAVDRPPPLRARDLDRLLNL